MIKLLAVDMDGTLLNDNKKISEANYHAVHRLKEAGIQVVLASGRSVLELERFIRYLDLTDFPHIGCSGGVVGRYKAHQEIVAYLDKEAYAQALNAFHQLGVDFYVFQEDLIFHEGCSATLENLKEFASNTEIVQYECALLEKPFKLCANFRNEWELEQLRRIAPDKLEAFVAADGFLDFAPKGINKMSGLSYIGSKFHIQPQEMAALGDDENDLAMLQGVGLGMAMKNARASVLKQYGKVLEKTNEEDGVAYFIDHYLLNHQEEK